MNDMLNSKVIEGPIQKALIAGGMCILPAKML